MAWTRRSTAIAAEPAAPAALSSVPTASGEGAVRRGLTHIDLRQETPDPAALDKVSGDVARRLGVVPLRMEGARLVVAVSDADQSHLAEVETALGSPLILCIAPAAQIARLIDTNYRALTSVSEKVAVFETRDSLRKAALTAETAHANDEAPVVQVVQMVLTQGLRDRASDIHIEPQGERVRVRYRIDGALHEVLDLPGSIGPALVSRIKIMGGMNIVERRRPQDGQIAINLDGRDVDIRVATTATIWGEKVVMRLLDKSRTLHKLSDLGMPTDTSEQYSKIIRSPYGMVVCAGPTGSGKTTTLYGSLSEINDPTRNITTIEDPVEYVFPSINQIQVNAQAGVTFATGLKSVLRQDPDVILIGEVRDAETARIAVQSALTGHFVLSSLHATDAASALHRLLDMEIEPFLVASSVTAVVSQRLARRICEDCRAAYEPTNEEHAFYESVGGAIPAGGFTAGAGCTFCANTGYARRIGVYELLMVSEEIKELVLRRAPHTEVRKLARSQGMRTLQEEAVQLVESGVTTIAEVLRSIYAVGS